MIKELAMCENRLGISPTGRLKQHHLNSFLNQTGSCQLFVDAIIQTANPSGGFTIEWLPTDLRSNDSFDKSLDRLCVPLGSLPTRIVFRLRLASAN